MLDLSDESLPDGGVLKLHGHGLPLVVGGGEAAEEGRLGAGEPAGLLKKKFPQVRDPSDVNLRDQMVQKIIICNVVLTLLA